VDRLPPVAVERWQKAEKWNEQFIEKNPVVGQSP
jgi:hypothetical protein